MHLHTVRSRALSLPAPVAQFRRFRIGALFLLIAALLPAPAAPAQQNAPATSTADQPTAQAPSSTATPKSAEAPTPSSQESQPAPAAPSGGAVQSPKAASIGEDQLRKLLEGKDLFLRGGYLDNSLAFSEHGVLIGHSPQGSYTLCGIRINKVRLLRHKVELEGARYGLHFLGALPYEDPTKAVDRVNITPKKKQVRITIDRELVVKPKQHKGMNKGKPPAEKPVAAAPPSATAPASAQGTGPETSDAGKALAVITPAPPEERPADVKSVTTTTSPAHANKVLEEALDNVFAEGFDARMMASMPGFWKLYYQAVAEKADFRPKDPNVLRQSMVDKKARLVTVFEPVSNQFAQDYGVAGMSEYHVVVGADGKPGEISVARPIGFGLDESAVDAIRKATFEPAVKGGQPVPVILDMEFVFRIYSNRTAIASKPSPDQPPEAPSLPGPYSVQH